MDLWQLFAVLLLLAIVVFSVASVVIYVTSIPMAKVQHYESEKYFLDPKKDDSKVLFPSIHDPASVDLSVIVPAYNEEERLPVMLDETLEFLGKRQQTKPSFKYEIIVVDDGSSDKTTEVAMGYCARNGTEKLRVLTLAKNRGKGGAIRLGMLRARGKHLLFADADAATKFSDLEKLENSINSLTKDGSEMAVVCGSRAHLQDEAVATRSFFRTILMYGFHILVWFLVKGIKDTQCGFKLLTRQAAVIIFTNLHVERWAFDVDMLYIANSLNMKISEVAVNWHEVEGSKIIPFWSWLQMAKDLLLIWMRYTMGAWQIDAKVKAE
ncbi:dolichyl-phosphate beta-glucosyltransferase [Lingula anatina]|uniref:Dolichyl-phosphate beta-glucosyltransferase n=1 Tax=Lingula anatina TaxID=7574 RepID=A0A1S3KF25_LINAN|nr:dolichyl-phosphate beta-glucosyltransferase [Lingula anatina]|eukprot:XP_013421087.1 dolichyl-phosphate beta-glucosyltransferase [Lingula anatina]